MTRSCKSVLILIYFSLAIEIGFGRPEMDPFEETLQRIFAEGKKRKESIKAKRNKVTVFHLGPGSPEAEKQRRLNLASDLRTRGIKVIVMEELPDRMSPTFSEKFLEIVGQFDPDLYIAIFTK